jgi:uncharacterized protein (TIGR03118 family)
MARKNLGSPVLISSFETLERRQLFSAAVLAYTQTNLVSDGAVSAAHTDANLVNAWGLALNKFGQFWVGDNGTGLSTVYDDTGVLGSPIVNIPPATGGSANAAVTGVVTNNAKTFNLTENGVIGRAVYLFASEDGTISGWNPDVDLNNAIKVVDNSASGAIYKGIAIAGKGRKALVFAANFHAGTIDVFDSNYQPVATVGGFADPSLPAGYAPFNVQVIGKRVYVTYAVQDSTAEDDVKGAGNGIVNVFDTKGRLKTRFVSNGGALDSPWAVVQGTSKFKNDVLIGNFGDGKINAFNKHGELVGTAVDANNQPLVIDGLWGLAYGAHHDKHRLFFAAGPNDEANGLFGVLDFVKLSVSATPGDSSGGPTFPGY